jgi:serine/threonine protein kinase
MIGQLLTGRYLILEKLGTGGFSETYLARDKYLPQHPLCVVKCLNLPSTSKISPETARRLFETEARVMERLGRTHSQIPRLLAYCQEHEQIYLVQDYIDGENLAKWVKRGQQLSTKAAIALLSDLLHVLAYLHDHHIIHRDIKPSNVMRRRRDGKMVLIDFGAACLAGAPHSTLPDQDLKSEHDPTFLAIGTPGYMPDEQQLGMAKFNSDLYALGMLVIYLLTGVKPQQFQQDLITGELDWKQYLPKKPIQPELITILERMVRSKFSDRYQQAIEVLNDLQQLTPAHRLGRLHAITRSRQTLRRVMIAGITSVLVGGGGGYVYAHSHQAELLLSRLGERLSSTPLHLTPLHELSVPSPVEQMMIAGDNRLITASQDHQLRFWSLSEGKLINTISGHTKTTAIALSRDRKTLATGGADGGVRLWDIESGRFLRSLPGQHPITAVAFSGDGQTLMSGNQQGILQQWNLQTGNPVKRIVASSHRITALADASKSGRFLSASHDRQIHVWDRQTGELQRTFTGHTEQITSLQLLDDHTLMSVGSDRTLMWDLNREELSTVISNNSLQPTAAIVESQRMAAMYENGTLQIWQRQDNRLVAKGSKTLKPNTIAALSPSFTYLVSGNTNRLQVSRINLPGSP